MSDEEKHLSSNGVYKPEIASAIANLKVIAKWGGPGVLRASRLRNSARRISAQFSDGPPTASAETGFWLWLCGRVRAVSTESAVAAVAALQHKLTPT